jgi:hypothetical protein
VLLHELMHIYHSQRLPGGRNNPDALRFYREELARGGFPRNACLLTNAGEFFAMTASTVL